MSVIVYIHKGDSFYLNDIFTITRKSNPNQKIVLLGDNENKKYAEMFNFEFHHIDNFPVSNFNYKHYSVNTINYEKFCYERWIILNSFLKTTTYETVIYSDSDNAFYMDINLLLNSDKTQNYDVLYLGNDTQIVPNIFIVKPHVCNIISRGIFDFFNQPDKIIQNLIKTRKLYYQDTRVHFSDMFILKYILNHNSYVTTFNIGQNHVIDGCHIDINYNDIKDQITIVDNIPYYGEKKLFNNHFWGNTKRCASLFI